MHAQACNLLSGNINLGGSSHDAGFQENNVTNPTATLSNGNFVIAWETRDDVDGNGNGGFFQVFDEAGTAITSVTMPYDDINAAGTGDQGTSGPRVVALSTGFVIAWQSEDGPGDTGPVGDEQTDIYFRIYNNDGISVNATTRVSVAGEEDKLSYVLPLSTGGFVILMHIDEDETGNKDDYFFEAFNSSGASTSGDLINITGGAHDAAFQTIDQGSAMLDLGGGNFVVSWESRDDIDGDGNGGFFRIFNANGTAVTNVVMPYEDINSGGTGDQASPGPITMGLANGNFVIAWESQQGPGDIGPAADDMQDIYFRIYSSNGTSVTGTTKANSDNTSDEEQLNGMIELTGGNFAMLYHRDEDDIGNKDDYFIRTFTSAGVAAGNSFEISSGMHLDNFSTVNSHNRGLIALNNGNFAVGWAARDDSDGDDAGAYYRVFNDEGAAVSPVVFPYQDINPGGVGKQSTFGPILKTLPNGFAMAWQSEQGPGDVGPAADDQQDVYHRVIDNNGSPLCGTTKSNSGNDAEEEILIFVEALANGNFVVVYKDDEDDTGNKDDYFFRVIGGAPLQILCPALGNATVSASAVCIDNGFNITVTDLQNMAMSDNNEQNYGVRFVAFADATSNPYSGGNLLGTVPFGNLTNNGTTATLSGISINTADPNLFIYAILDVNSSDVACLPNATAMIEIVDNPIVFISAPADLCISVGIQTGLGGGTPSGGIYSGPGVTDDGNGLTYSFDPSAAGIGTHTIGYNFTNATGCTGSASDNFEVFATPTVVILAPADLCFSAGIQTGLGGGAPTGGIYSGPGVTDEGNGSTYSFDPTVAGIGTHSISYNFTNANGCAGNASDNIEVFALPIVSFVAPSNLCLNTLGQIGLGGGTPAGGVYDGVGVTDDGNGMTYSFDPSIAGVGTTSITYSYSDANNCMASSSDVVEVFALPTVTLDLPDTLYMTQAIPQLGVGGGLPSGGNYTSNYPDEMSDDGNGITFSFTNQIFINGDIQIIYSYTDINGCENTASHIVHIADTPVAVDNLSKINVEIFPNPTTGFLEIQGTETDRIEVIDLHGRIMQVEIQPTSSLDISNLTSGIYFLKIHVEDQIIIRRIIKY